VIASTPKMGGSSIGPIDTKTNEWIQNIPAPPNAHSVVIS
jgi:hypothetical protein